MVIMKNIPFRVGTTSYIYRADIFPNVKKLAHIIDDIELVLFDCGDDDGVPKPDVLDKIKKIGCKSEMSFTIHLPLSLSLGDPDKATRDTSVDLVSKIIDRTNIVTPAAYIIHLNSGKSADSDFSAGWYAWTTSCRESLRVIIPQVKDAGALCIENLESYHPSRLAPIIETLPVSLCLDIGHLWVQNLDPVLFIEKYRERIRVVHIHGINKRDHASLEYVDKNELNRALNALVEIGFNGILTIEVFNKRDLKRSLRKIREWSNSR